MTPSFKKPKAHDLILLTSMLRLDENCKLICRVRDKNLTMHKILPYQLVEKRRFHDTNSVYVGTENKQLCH